MPKTLIRIDAGFKLCWVFCDFLVLANQPPTKSLQKNTWGVKWYCTKVSLYADDMVPFYQSSKYSLPPAFARGLREGSEGNLEIPEAGGADNRDLEANVDTEWVSGRHRGRSG